MLRTALFVAAVLMVASQPCAAAPDELPPAVYPALVPQAASLEGFVPASWRLEKTLSGDLNDDGKADAVLLLRDANPKNIIETGRDSAPRFDTNPRILAVAFAGDGSNYRLALDNHSLISRTDDPWQQDPLDPDGIQEGGIEIRNGTLRVTLAYFAGDMGRTTFTFRFQNGGFELIGYDRVNVTRNSGVTSDLSINYSTRNVVRKTGSISDDASKVMRSKLPRKHLLTMQEIGDGLMFQPVPD